MAVPAEVESDDRSDTGRRGSLDQKVAIAHRERERLLDEDVLAGIDRREHDLRMQVTGRGHADHVDRRIREQVAVIAAPAADSEMVSGGAQRLGARVRQGDRLGLVDAGERRQVEVSARAAAADQADCQGRGDAASLSAAYGL